MLDGVDAISTSVPSMSKNHAQRTSACGGRLESLLARGLSADRCTRNVCLRSHITCSRRTAKNFSAASDCGRIDEHSSSPSEHVELANQRAHDLHSRSLPCWRHCERNVQRFRTLLDVVRVHDQGFGQLTRRSGELTEDENARVVVARCDELLCDEIHSIVETADKAQLRRPIVLVNLDRLVMLHEEDDRRVQSIGESRVDACHKRSNFLLVLLIILYARARWRS